MEPTDVNASRFALVVGVHMTSSASNRRPRWSVSQSVWIRCTGSSLYPSKRRSELTSKAPSRCSNATSCANSVRRRDAGSTRVEICSVDYAGSMPAAGSAGAQRGMETSCARSLSGVSVASRISTVAHTNAHAWATNAHRRSSSPL